MKSLTKIVLAAVATLAALTIGQAATAEVGKTAPDFTLTDINGKQRSLSDFKGKTVVLEWVNQECPFVVKHYDKSGNMPKTQPAAAKDGVVWLQINSGHPGAQGDFEPAKVADWQKRNAVVSTAYFRDQDGKVGKLYDARTTPHMYVVDPSGTLSTFAGTALPGFTGDGGPANQARLSTPTAVATDRAGNVYITDSINSRVRTGSPSGIISTVAKRRFT